MMSWKKIKIGILIILGLILITPILLYMNAIDLTKSHEARVNSLPIFSDLNDEGEFRIQANGLEFLIRTAGMTNQGPEIILLHGFPESSIMWESMLEACSSAGYRVVAIDQRGYSPNARPSGVEQYHIDHLVTDIMSVATEVGFDSFHLVGHDWGAVVGWKATMDFPERIQTWTAMSIPHIGVFFDAVLNHPEQQKRSAYINTLKTPYIPDFMFQVEESKFFKRVEGIWTDRQITEYKAIRREHGAITAALNWYRAIDIEQVVDSKAFEKSISRPTLYIWGSEDGVITEEIIPNQEALIRASYTELRLETGHSLMQLKEDSVIHAILMHIAAF